MSAKFFPYCNYGRCKRWLGLVAGVWAGWFCTGTAGAQGWVEVIRPTNHVWKYLATGPEPAAEWKLPEFDDSAWNSGVGLFGFEGSSLIYPYPFQTIWLPDQSRLTYYARTHFQWNGTGWHDVLLRLTNYVDDGAVFYINGREVGRLRLTNDVVGFDTPANFHQPNEGRPEVLEVRIPFLLNRGDNLMAVEIHNASMVSGDIAFGLSMSAIECHFDLFPRTEPRSQVVLSCRPATIRLVDQVVFGPGMRWMKDGEPLPNETNLTLTIPRVMPQDQGEYYVEFDTPCGTFASTTSLLLVSLDTTLPALLGATFGSGLTNMVLTFSDSLDPASIQLTDIIVDDVCLPGRLKTTAATLVDGTNLVVTTSPRATNQNYSVSVQGMRDDCNGNVMMPTTVLVTPVVRLGGLSMHREFGGVRVLWSGCGVLQTSSNLVNWIDVPGVTAGDQYLIASPTNAAFFRLRLP